MVRRAQYCFLGLFPDLRKIDCVSCPKIFLRAESNPVALKNNTEHADPLFIAFVDNVAALAIINCMHGR